MNTKVWTTKDGQRIRIKDMTDTHLMNTIKMMERKVEEEVADIPYPVFQGEMAQFYADQDYEAAIRMTPYDRFELYGDMIEEANRRGLKLALRWQ